MNPELMGVKKVEPEIKYPAQIAVDAVKGIVFAVSKVLWFLSYRQTENIPQKLPGGLLIVANHQTYLDPFWICIPVKRKFRFMAYDKAFDWFLIGRIIKYLGSFPVSLEGIGTRKAWKTARQSLENGATLVIFPEGSREFSDGKFLPFKAGAIRLAWETKVSILPVTVRGANQAWAQDMKFPCPFRRVEIIYHPLFEIPELPTGTDLQEHLQNQNNRLIEIIGLDQSTLDKSCKAAVERKSP